MNSHTPSVQQPVCFFLVSALAYYTKDGEQKQRHLNVLLDAENPNLPKMAISQIQRAVMQRLNAENGVEVNEILDVVVNNICLMGQMTPAEFHNEPAVEPAQSH